ncbi:DUF1772 domain-containing protein [Mycolicibacterium sp. S2-37]|uniref:anthrone oxygenase family protein n=1 Tax=Mycolicibacterium sp. S2-37 TaxID=2810297 RepID=UPI001A942648|nr:anthrone oxygenase family protein [Mycolicibacterium sp. S2-37]MBO0681026.1 DUF1772 domain-containing protein [Mycolicibacterium sp. S2-37]
MASHVSTVLTVAAIVTSAAVGGLFYAFSTFVMRGLDRTDPVSAITAMRGINAEAQANAPFLALFTGSALLAVAVGVATVLRWHQPGNGYLLTGAALGVVAFVVTVAFNVPLNNHLAGLAPAAMPAADAAAEWRAYFSSWTAWNHVRTVGGFAAAALMLTGLLQR